MADLKSHLPQSALMKALADLEQRDALLRRSDAARLRDAVPARLQDVTAVGQLTRALAEVSAGEDRDLAARPTHPGAREAEPQKPQTLDLPSLAAAVREARTALGKSQGGICRARRGVGRRFLSNWRNAKPTLEIGKVLQVLAAAGIDLYARQR